MANIFLLLLLTTLSSYGITVKENV
ncbi:hypothetical protein E2C01_083176 [Portunus trituberculatus]|uniref:Uncharacterized protein n=1 Tax=Portunus trituberculatus TaxID=210409 RepID=A0A5B7J2S3_PORTR|nr:hypothetical protein [Portunus trituberculatus]